jgi:hypothetical protein
MADEQAFEDYLIDKLGPRIAAAWDEVGRELIEGQGTGQPRGVMTRALCGKPLHKACRCVRDADHAGPCNCAYPDGRDVLGTGSGWIPADAAIEAIDKQRPDRARPYRYRGGSA